MFGDHPDQVIQQFRSLLLGELVLFGQRIGQVPGGNCSDCWGCHRRISFARYALWAAKPM
jgi:hypothetical protein